MEDLSIAFHELQSRIGAWLGYGRGNVVAADTAWKPEQAARIKDGTKGGLARFYWPWSEQHQNTYDWSFLRPFETVTLLSGNSTVLLPQDFGGLEGSCFLPDSTSIPRILTNAGPAQIASRFAILPDETGSPEFVAIRPRKITGAGPQRNELYVFPEADADYEIQFQYYINPTYLSGDMPYAYGGPQHAQTLLAACLATTELDWDGKIAEREVEFQKRLSASIQIDRRNKQQFFGYNGNPIRDRHGVHWRRAAFPVITIGGLTPE